MSIYSIKVQHLETLANTQPNLALSYLQENFNHAELGVHTSILKSIALFSAGNIQEAKQYLEESAQRHNKSADIQFQLGIISSKMDAGKPFIQHFRRTCELDPDNLYFSNTFLLAAQSLNNKTLIQEAENRHSTTQKLEKIHQLATKLLKEGNVGKAKNNILKSGTERTSAKSNVLLAEIYEREGNRAQSIAYLSNAYLICQNNFTLLNLAKAQLAEKDYYEASQTINLLIKEDQENPNFIAMQAAAAVGLARFQDAELAYLKLNALSPKDGRVLIRLGNIQKIIRKPEEAERNYRTAIEIDPTNTEAYWSIANLKKSRLTSTDINALNLLKNSNLNDEKSIYLNFSLGRAYEEQGKYEISFEHYKIANKRKMAELHFDKSETETTYKNINKYFQRRNLKIQSIETAIFIVGMPRSGSTLLEQILSCHSAIDTTMELNEITRIARALHQQARSQGTEHYLNTLNNLSPKEVQKLGQSYLDRTKNIRGKKTYFIDKMPSNFNHIGLIKTILPNAKIIDIRRDPISCGFSIYKQYFAEGLAYSYDLENIATYYKYYLKQMKFWRDNFGEDILTIHYEDLVENIEKITRQTLQYLELDFEPECLKFYASKRPVATPSAEQVRQPLKTDGNTLANHYFENLTPLIELSKQYP